MSFQKKWNQDPDCPNPKFFDYNPAYEQKSKEERTAYLFLMHHHQAIAPGKNKSFSIEAPMYTDKKFAQPGSG